MQKKSIYFLVKKTKRTFFPITTIATLKSSQVALEFIMTYGWAIMVALIAVGTIAYFGVLDPDKFYPTACTLEAGIGCSDFKVDEGSITLVLRNGKGEDVTITSITAKNCTGAASGSIKNGDQGVFVIDGCRNEEDSKLVSDLNITLSGESGIVHKKIGRIVGKVESGGATPLSLPSVPTGLSAAAGNSQIDLAWNAPSNDGGSQITSYRVFKGTSPNSESYFALSASTGYTDTQVTNGQTYYYQVTAVNIVGESNRSNEASATPCDSNVIVTYGNWGSCSASCGGGTQTRTNVNQCGQNVVETQSCNTQPCCDPNVIVSCGSWGSCSVSCGGGTQTRTCTNQCGDAVQPSQSCNTQCCPINGGWSAWSSWSAWNSCSASCGSGTQTRTRTRTCTSPANSCGGAVCTGSNTETETQSCNTQPCCDSNVIVSCGSWGACSVSCGGGSQARTCTNQCGNAVSQSQSCTDNSGYSTASSCGSWSACSTKCGSGTQSRTCNNLCSSTFTQSQGCYDNSGSSAISSCGSWGSCSTKCGSGTQTRTCSYVCGGTTTQSQGCTDTSSVGVLSSCGGWGSCSTSCGWGSQSRTCNYACGGSTSQSQSCYDGGSIGQVSSCSGWGSCSASCGSGTQSRTCYYVCGGSYQDSSGCSGTNCPGCTPSPDKACRGDVWWTNLGYYPNPESCGQACAAQGAICCEWYSGNGDCYPHWGSGPYLIDYGGWYAKVCQ